MKKLIGFLLAGFVSTNCLASSPEFSFATMGMSKTIKPEETLHREAVKCQSQGQYLVRERVENGVLSRERFTVNNNSLQSLGSFGPKKKYPIEDIQEMLKMQKGNVMLNQTLSVISFLVPLVAVARLPAIGSKAYKATKIIRSKKFKFDFDFRAVAAGALGVLTFDIIDTYDNVSEEELMKSIQYNGVLHCLSDGDIRDFGKLAGKYYDKQSFGRGATLGGSR